MEEIMKIPRIRRIILLIALVVILSIVAVTVASASPGEQQAGPPEVVVTPEGIAAIAGVVLSLAFSYIPGLNTRFAALAPEAKRGIMAGLLVLTAAVIYGLGCLDILSIGIACTQTGVIQIVWILISALVTNQTTYSVSPQLKSVREAAVSRYMASPE
jgi:hypothetical protein